MAGTIGDISSGLTGVSHTTGEEYKAMPSKSAIRPTGSTIVVHTDKALSVSDSSDQLMEFVRGESLQSYSPQENRDLRVSLIEYAVSVRQAEAEGMGDTDIQSLDAMIALLRQDADLDVAASMARALLIPA